MAGKRINPVDTHDWLMIPDAFNAVCKNCGIQMWPAFRGLNPNAAETCLGNPEALAALCEKEGGGRE